MPNQTTEALRQAAKGLLYISEKDEPFKVFSWREEGSLSGKKVLALGKHDPDSPVVEMSPEEFFTELTEEQDWHGAEEKETVRKYRKLWEVLQDKLTEVRVYRVGETDVTIYLVGKTKQGNWAGLKTSALET